MSMRCSACALNRSDADCACRPGSREASTDSASPSANAAIRSFTWISLLFLRSVGARRFSTPKSSFAARLFTATVSPRILRCMKRISMALAILMAAASLDAQQPAAPAPANDPIRTLVSRLDLEKYKATIKGLTAFGDRRQGTKRNRDAVDWIEAQLKSYGCAHVERIP